MGNEKSCIESETTSIVHKFYVMNTMIYLHSVELEKTQ